MLRDVAAEVVGNQEGALLRSHRRFATQVRVPTEFQGTVIGDLNRRKGLIQDSNGEGDDVVIAAQVPLSDMFGYSTAIRSMTQVLLGGSR